MTEQVDRNLIVMALPLEAQRLGLEARLRGRNGSAEPFYALARCCCGLTPRTRLNALLSAKELPYPTRRATEPTVAPGSINRSAASVSRQLVRKVIGGAPTSSLQRRASAARRTPVADASVATVHGWAGLWCSRRRAGPTMGSECARYQPGARDFADYARDAAATGIWQAAP